MAFRTRKGRQPVPAGQTYDCAGCRRPLELERVVSADVERAEGALTGYVVFEHSCRCTEGDIRVSRAWGSYPGFLALFGGVPALPYVSNFTFTPVTGDEPPVRRWAWELAQVADVEDFMLFLDDAAERHHRYAA